MSTDLKVTRILADFKKNVGQTPNRFRKSYSL